MASGFSIAVTGHTIINRRLSVHDDANFLAAIKLIREADAAYTHLETVIHDYDGPEIYPAAEAGWTWMRAPRFVADELKWAGFNLVSDASNHTLDYSYGGLYSTWKALEKAGLVHAGTGRSLGEAREPAYLDTPKGRVALIAMCSSFTGWARAGETRRDVKGRPGLNPLRFYYVADAATIAAAKEFAFKLGWSVTQIGRTWLFNPPGLWMATHRFVEGDGPGISTMADEGDIEGNLASVRDAARQADCVLVTIHTHEWHPDGGLSAPPAFLPPFARACVDAGAHVFIAQGSHSPLRGIEIYKGRPVFYDPGDFIGMSNTVTRLPSDFYLRPGYPPDIRRPEMTTADGFDARAALPKPLNPTGGSGDRVNGSVVALCSLGGDGNLAELKLYPVTMSHRPRSRAGIPGLVGGEAARAIIDHLAELSLPFGTKIEFKEGIGSIQIGTHRARL
ncbi:MAG: CapA family protein [Chloroflexi bacterium]|nr:CapA family protein [Chloroflexota bacterium]